MRFKCYHCYSWDLKGCGREIHKTTPKKRTIRTKIHKETARYIQSICGANIVYTIHRAHLGFSYVNCVVCCSPLFWTFSSSSVFCYVLRHGMFAQGLYKAILSLLLLLLCLQLAVLFFIILSYYCIRCHRICSSTARLMFIFISARC